jgi:hypothetical protein
MTSIKIKDIKGLHQESTQLGSILKNKTDDSKKIASENEDATVNKTKNKLNLNAAEDLSNVLAKNLPASADKALNVANLDEDRVNQLLSED